MSVQKPLKFTSGSASASYHKNISLVLWMAILNQSSKLFNYNIKSSGQGCLFFEINRRVIAIRK